MELFIQFLFIFLTNIKIYNNFIKIDFSKLLLNNN